MGRNLVSILLSNVLILLLVYIFAYSRPAPYECVITPRFPEVESILAEERERFGIQL